MDLKSRITSLLESFTPKNDSFYIDRKYEFIDIGNGIVPIEKVTPQNGSYIHTFFDICPFSPSQRYLAVTSIPFEDRVPVPGDLADICVIDLKNQAIKKIYTTQAWGMQLGANLEWGKSDRYLYSNEIVNGQGVGLRIDLKNRKTKIFSGPKYNLSPDETEIIGFPLDLINATQGGYGIPEKKRNPKRLPPGASKNIGLFRTNLKNNRTKLLASLRDFYQKIPDKKYFVGTTFYLAHSKYNKKGDRIMQVVRCLIPGRKGIAPQLFTLNRNGKEIKLAIKHQDWEKGGHHPNWCPDSKHLLMNLNVDGKMRFCQFKYDGSDFEIISKKIIGSGHPSMERTERYLITDSYPHEFPAKGSRVPIRLIDLKNDREQQIVKVNVGNARGEIRVDPHPVWSRDYKKICFNGLYRGKRQVFIADLSEVI